MVMLMPIIPTLGIGTGWELQTYKITISPNALVNAVLYDYEILKIGNIEFICA